MNEVAKLVTRLSEVMGQSTFYSQHGDSCEICIADREQLIQIQKAAEALSENMAAPEDRGVED